VSLGDGQAHLTLALGSGDRRQRTEVKAITHHQARLRPSGAGWTAHWIADV
jgi:SHS2 domain-containing protein